MPPNLSPRGTTFKAPTSPCDVTITTRRTYWRLPAFGLQLRSVLPTDSLLRGFHCPPLTETERPRYFSPSTPLPKMKLWMECTIQNRLLSMTDQTKSGICKEINFSVISKKRVKNRRRLSAKEEQPSPKEIWEERAQRLISAFSVVAPESRGRTWARKLSTCSGQRPM